MSSKARLRKDKGREDDDGDAKTSEDFLDTSEQNEVIKRMRDENEKQNKWSRTVFSLLGLGLGLVKLYYASSQAFYPWQMQPHTELMGKVTYDAVAIWEFFSGISFILIGYYVNPIFDVNNFDKRWWGWISAVVFSFTTLGLWFYNMGPAISMLLVWFVGGNVVFCLVGLYTEWLIRNSEHEIALLMHMTYNYQKA